MPDLNTFGKKIALTAQRQGPTAALRHAAAEVAAWTYSRGVEWRCDTVGDLIWDAEWDICVVADACRMDLFREVQPGVEWLPDAGDAQTAWSVGSCSPEWYGNTFGPGIPPADESIGVVTANPFASKPAERLPTLAGTPIDEHPAVDAVEYVFQESWGCEINGEHLDVTHPAVVINSAYKMWAEHDLDRLVVHLMQPHIPFRSRPEWFGKRANLDSFGEEQPGLGGPYQTQTKELWKQLRDGEVDRDAVWSAYKDNLRWALEETERLRRGVDARLLLTSDHGNGMGEFGIWSHPPGMQIPALREVPWVFVDGAAGRFERREVDAGTADESVDDQLRALGYV